MYEYELICDDEVTAQKLAKEFFKEGCNSIIIKAQGYFMKFQGIDGNVESKYLVKVFGLADYGTDKGEKFKRIYKKIRDNNPQNHFPIDWSIIPALYGCFLPDGLT